MQVRYRYRLYPGSAQQRALVREVSSDALVQACQDARRAYRNWFNSLPGKRKGRKAGHPRTHRGAA